MLSSSNSFEPHLVGANRPPTPCELAYDSRPQAYPGPKMPHSNFTASKRFLDRKIRCLTPISASRIGLRLRRLKAALWGLFRVLLPACGWCGSEVLLGCAQCG